MSQIPPFLTRDRILDAVALPVLSIAQAGCLAIGIFATRAAFSTLHENTPLPPTVLIKLIGAGVCVALFEWLRRICAVRVGQSYANDFRARLYRHLAGMHYSDIESRRLGALSLRFVGDMTAARSWYSLGLPQIIAGLIILPGSALILYALDQGLAYVASLILGVTILVLGLCAVGFERLHSKLRSRRANISIAMMERIAIAPQLDLVGRTPRELKNLHLQGKELRANAISHANRSGILQAVPQIGLALAGAAVLNLGAQINSPPGTIAASLSLLVLLMVPLRDLAIAWDHYNAWRIAKTKAQNLFAKPYVPREIEPRNGATPVAVFGSFGEQSVTLDICAEAIGYLQGPSLHTLNHVALVMAGLNRDPAISVKYAGNTALPKVSYIGDKTLALQGSLRRALCLGIEPRPKRGPVFRMALEFGLKDLFPNGKTSLDQRIAEMGRNVSMQDRLRIELTRAALSQPDLIIINSSQFLAEAAEDALLLQLKQTTDATIVVVDQRQLINDGIRFQAYEDSPLS